MLQNRQSHRHSLCNVMSHVVLFACSINLNISTKKRVSKILPKKLYCEKMCFIGTLKKSSTLGGRVSIISYNTIFSKVLVLLFPSPYEESHTQICSEGIYRVSQKKTESNFKFRLFKDDLIV